MLKVTLWERFLLLFHKAHYTSDYDENTFVTLKYKIMKGNVYVLKEKINILEKVGD